MNITLSVEETVVKSARKRAESMGKSLNQVVREYLHALAGGNDAGKDVEALRRLTAEGGGRSRGWHFNRDEIHERP